jgi:AAA+ ATPase superfamily predicted ATPase
MKIEFPRSELANVGHGWTMVYGRRKVGKTYMLKRFVDWNVYLLVGLEGTVWVEGMDVGRLDSMETVVDVVMGSLRSGKTVIIDEFQRISMGNLERISSVHPDGRLILSGSSMGVMSRILGPGSPLLGRFREKRVGLVRPEDLLNKLPKGLPLDYAPYLSDPWTVPLLGGKGILGDLHDLLGETVNTVPSLIGEIFHTEDRNLSEVYQGILGCIGSGATKPSEIASTLYHRGVIKKDSASHVSPYINALKEMGLVKELSVYGKKRSAYRIGSSTFWVYYYMESRYGLERGLPKLSEVEENLRRVHHLCVEDYMVETVSRWLGGYLKYSFEPEIDGIVVDRKGRPKASIEVKWGRLRKADVDAFLEKTEHINAPRYVVAKRALDRDDVTFITPDDLRGMFTASSGR